MALKLSVPTIKEFHLTTKQLGLPVPAQLVRCETPEDKIDVTVIFRQGTNQDDEQRSTWANRRKYVYDEVLKTVSEISELSPSALAKLEVLLTLSGIDLQLPDGKELDFEVDQGTKRVKSRAQFDQLWGLIPSQWAAEIYKCCLEVNPDWGDAKR